MTIVLLQLFSRDTTRWIKVTDCGTSHWASHAMSLSLSRSLPPYFFSSLSLSLFISSLSLLVAFVLHPGVDGPAGAQTEMMTPWADGWWAERASSLASIGFLKLSETKAHFRTAAAHLPFWDSLRVDIFTETNLQGASVQLQDPDPTQTACIIWHGQTHSVLCESAEKVELTIDLLSKGDAKNIPRVRDRWDSW